MLQTKIWNGIIWNELRPTVKLCIIMFEPSWKWGGGATLCPPPPTLIEPGGTYVRSPPEPPYLGYWFTIGNYKKTPAFPGF